MQVVLIILSVGLLGLIVYFAVSGKSSRHLKRAAFIALGLIALALAVAGILLLAGPGEGAHHIPLPGFQEAQPAPGEDSNILEIMIFLLVFLLVIGLIIGISLKNQRKKEGAQKKAQKPLSSRPEKN